MQTSKLTFLAFQLNGALGSGQYDFISIEEVKSKIYDETIFEYLKSQLKSDIDVSIYKPEDAKELITEWQDMAGALNESRKLCVDKNGLCLLVAYLLEGIQRRMKP